MDKKIKQALEKDRVIDITTTGRKSGEPRRIEIAHHYIDEKIYISGLPGKRDWYANMMANPQFTFHLKKSMQADIPATSRPITQEDERRALFPHILANFRRPPKELERFVEGSKLIEVTLRSEEGA